ncbi:hypothetical protein GOP47_0030061 [Adiantum capillus-veneris]|nr:hypothetical protein GOP47_0030061 [Adiantum capillus-veneris]
MKKARIWEKAGLLIGERLISPEKFCLLLSFGNGSNQKKRIARFFCLAERKVKEREEGAKFLWEFKELMSVLMERQAGIGHLSKHAFWSSNRSTFVIVAAAAVMVLLGSILFTQSSMYLPKDLNGSAWASLQQSRNLAMISSADSQDYLSIDEEDIINRPKLRHNGSICSKESALLKMCRDTPAGLTCSTALISDFGRYSHQLANVDKDIVAPYKHMVPTFSDDASSFQSRRTLLFFQGAIVRKEGGIIRQQLFEMLKDEVGVHFSNGSAQKGGVRSASEGMRSSKFCLHLAGDTPSSNRLFDAIVSHCVPVIISDEIELPFEDQLDYSQFCMFVTSTDALQSGFLMGLLRSVKEQEWTRKWMLLKQLDRHFEYQHPAQPYDAVNMIWRTIARKVPSVKQSLNKAKRVQEPASWQLYVEIVVSKSIWFVGHVFFEIVVLKRGFVVHGNWVILIPGLNA